MEYDYPQKIKSLIQRVAIATLLCLIWTQAFAQLPDQFQKVELLDRLTNVVKFNFAPDGRIFILDRYGEVLIYKPNLGTTVSAGTIPVFHDLEDGLIGIALDPNFAVNDYVYLHYSPLSTSVNRVSRFTMNGDQLNMGSEVTLLEWPVQRTSCCHSGGDMGFDSNGNLYIATGDNTDHGKYAALDESESINSAEKSSSNSNDFRGKILRVTPQANGSYTIPAGNLFPGGSGGLPEIYVMGARNPYRIFIDKENTDWLFWGEVGPDANAAGPEGPMGMDEINLTKSAGNFGWPYFSGKNEAYLNDYSSPQFYYDPQAPVNLSTWNTGPQNLPAAEPSWLEFFHECYLAGPRYYYDPSLTDQQRLPVEFDEAFFYYDFNTSQIWVVKMDATGNITSNEQLAPAIFPVDNNGYIDLQIGPDGHLYILEYGAGCCPDNIGRGRLLRIDYTGQVTNSSPVVSMDADPTSGSLPLNVDFSSVGTFDPDGDPLTYAWDFQTDGTVDSNLENPSFTYTTQGVFNAQLRVDDGNGGVTTANITINAGNNAATFTFNSPLDGGFINWYDDVNIDLVVDDIEDGTTSNGTIDCNDVNIVPSLGHLNHFHDDLTISGCPGTITLDATNHDTEGEMDIFYVLGVNYTDQGGLVSFDQVRLHPKRKEAEFYDQENDVTLLANTDPWGGGSEAIRVNHDSYIVFEDRNLFNINSVKYRTASAGTGGTIELRLDSPTGPLLSTTTIPVSGAWDNWGDQESNITDPGGMHDLYFVFKNPGNQNLFDLNYVEFMGAGISTDNTPPDIIDLAVVSPTQVRIQFSEYVTQATAETLSNYAIDNGVVISSVTLLQDQRSVDLDISPIAAGTVYTLNVNNVQNLAGLVMAPSSQQFLLSDPKRINSGGALYTDTNGNTFDPDQYASGGQTFTTNTGIAGTTDDLLYQTERYGDFTYEIPLQNPGQYDVRLHFAEIFFGVGSNTGGVGSRVFNVDIEGAPALVNFDILTETASATALTKEFTDITVNDGFMTIEFSSVTNNPKISAVEVLEAGSIQPNPNITITSPSEGADVNQPFDVSFLLEDWIVQVGGTHIHKIIDGVNIGPHYSTDPVTFDSLGLGTHTIRLELYLPNHTGSGVFDEITVNVTDQLTCNTSVYPDQWTKHDVDVLSRRGLHILPKHDLDGDGLKDIATGAWWYKNPGTPSGNWTQNVIGTLREVAFVHDFDGDGDNDLLGTRNRLELFWAENNGSGNFTIHNNVPMGTSTRNGHLSGITGGVFQPGGPYQIAITWNFAEDGSSGVQMLTVPADPVNTNWTIATIHPTSLGEDLSSGDIDGDGDLDLFQAGNWLRNDGSSWTLFSTQLTLNTKFDRHELADVDRDGDLDGIIGQIGTDEEFVWFECPPNPTQAWTKNVIDADIDGVLSVDVADMDFDGDMDIVLGEWQGNYQLLSFENDLCNTGTWIKHVFDASGSPDHHNGAQIVDIDNDGDLDVVSNGWNVFVPTVYENLSGVPPVNSPPVVTNPGNQTYSEGASVSLQIQATDPNPGDVLTYSATNLPASLTIDSNSGLISGTLNVISGSYPVTVRAEDQAGLFDEVVFTIVVTSDLASILRVNAGGPSITFGSLTWLADQYFTGGTTFGTNSPIAGTNNDQLFQTERNANQGSMSYELPVAQPGDYIVRLYFAEIFHTTIGARVFDVDIEGGQGQLNNYDIVSVAGGGNIAVIESFNVNVTDGNVSITFTNNIDRSKISAIEILSASNVAPVVTNPGNQNYQEGATVNLQVVATDPNPGDVITYSASNLPANLSINSTTGLISGTLNVPTGDYSVTVRAEDQSGLFDEQTFIITVGSLFSLERINAGGPAVSFGTEDWVADQYFTGGTTFSTNSPIAGTTKDELFQTERNANNASMTYEIPVPQPGDYTIRLYFAEIFVTGIGEREFDVDIEGGQGQLTDYDIFEVAGGQNIAVIESFNVTVADNGVTIVFTNKVNRSKISAIEVLSASNIAPVAENPGPQAYGLGEVVSLQINATDPNPGDVLTYTALNLPGSLSIDSGTGLISGSLTVPAGDYPVTIRVEDQFGAFDQVQFTMTVGTLASLFRINAGGPEVTFGTENWTADQYFTGGTTFSTTADIEGTVKDELFQTERNANNASMMYEIPVPQNATYTVRLYFAEIFATAAGVRVFDVDVENGQGTLTDYDVFEAAGGQNIAVIESFNVAVADDNLTIVFTNNINRAKISAIEVLTSDLPNLPPVVYNPGDQFVNEGAAVSLQLEASDPNPGDVLTYFASNLPGSLTINPATGLISGTLDAPPGNYPITIRATDQGDLFDEDFFTISVGNFQPVFRINSGGPAITHNGENWVADQFFTDGTTFTNAVSISGTTNDELYQSERNTATGTFNYEIPIATPGEYIVKLHFAEIFHSSAGLREFSVEVENGQGILTNYDIVIQAKGPNVAVSESFNVTVNDGNLSILFTSITDRAKVSGIEILSKGNVSPVVVNPGDQTYDEASMVNLQINASDADAGDVLTFSATGLPQGLTIDPGTGLISGTLTVLPGNFQVTVRATDSGGLFDEETFTITVGDINLPPVLAAIGNQTVEEGATLDVALSATDPDGDIPVLSAQNLPAFATLTDNGDGTGTISINPGFSDAGSYDITVTATDGLGLFDEEQLTITVTEGNGTPVLVMIGNQTVAEGSSLDIPMSASDPDGDIPTFTADNLPAFAILTDNGNGTATITASPGFTDAGDYDITVRAADATGLFDEEVFTLTVTEGNGAPTLDPIGNQTVAEGDSEMITVTSSDPDGEIPVLSATSLPAFVTFTDNQDGTGLLSINPGFTDVGTYQISIVVTDALGLTDSESLTITITEANGAPIIADIPNQTLEEGTSLQVTISASDPDGEIPNITVENLEPFMSFTVNGGGVGILEIAPDFNEFGMYQIMVRATDAGGLFDEQLVDINVTENTTNPEWVVNGTVENANCLNENGSIELEVSGGLGESSYSWSNGAASKDIYELSSGVYSVTITDEKGNTTEESFTVNTQPGPQKPTVEQVENDLISSAALSYQWNLDGEAIEGATSQTIEVTLAGNYSVTIFDDLGCSVESDPVEIEFEFNQLIIYPNPNDGKFTMELTLMEAEGLVFDLIDNVGRITPVGVYNLAAGRHKLDITLPESLANGVYLLRNNGKHFQSNLNRISIIR